MNLALPPIRPRKPAEIAQVAAEIAALSDLRLRDLSDRYEDLFGEPPRSRNRDYLKKRIAYRLQELAFGGLSDAAKRRIEELAATTPLRRRNTGAAMLFSDGEETAPEAPATPLPTLGSAKPRATKPAPTSVEPPCAAVVVRDPRLPPSGTVLERTYRGQRWRVTVLDNGFVFDGVHYASLTTIATAITGSRWNGFTFFGLGKAGGSR
jgi:hypothetical protein